MSFGLGQLGAAFGQSGSPGGGRFTNTLFGLNMSGAEFSTPNFPSSADWSYIASKGVTFVRLPVAWENLLTTIGGATLAATYLANLKTAIAGAHAVGIGVIVDLHNFGAYTAAAQWGSTVTYAGNGGTTATGVSFFGAGVASTDFAHIWTLLVTALSPGGVPRPGVIGYGIMNEPNQSINGGGTNGMSSLNWLFAPNGFTNTIGATQTWQQFNPLTVTQLGAGTNPLGATYGPAWNVANGASGYGIVTQYLFLNSNPYIFSVYAKVASGTNANYNYGLGGATAVATLTTSWQRFSQTFVASGPQNVQAAFISDGNVGELIQIANAQLEQAASTASLTSATIAASVLTATVGSGTLHVGDLIVGANVTAGTKISSFGTGTGASGNTGTYNLTASSTVGAGEAMTAYNTVPTAYQPNPYIPFAQAAINAIQAVDTTTPIYVNGLDTSSATWPNWNWDLGLQLTTVGPSIIYEAHMYPDGTVAGGGDGGQFSGTYTSYGSTVNSGSQLNAPFLSWLTTVSLKGFLGETNVIVSATDNNAAWLPQQIATLKNLRSNNVPGALWSYRNSGSDPSHTDILNVAPQSGVDDPRLIQMLAS